MLARMLKVESQLTKLRTNLVAIRPPDGTKISYDLQADIKAVSRDGTRIKIRFAINIDTFPLIYRAEIGGFALANAEMLAKEESIEDLGEEVLGDIALQIFRQNFEALYLTLATQGLDAPSPWLVRDVHMAN
jgi:hypothetical protein